MGFHKPKELVMNTSYAEYCAEMQRFDEFRNSPYAQSFLRHYDGVVWDAGPELSYAQLWHCCQELDSGPTFRSKESWRRWYHYQHPCDPAGYDEAFLAGHFDENDLWVAD